MNVAMPTIIHVPMEIESVRRIKDPNGKTIYQVFGYVGDYNVSIWLDETEAKATGLAARAL